MIDEYQTACEFKSETLRQTPEEPIMALESSDE